ncbi:hypothetical protein Goari_020454, partial [Gossypium aridum]|nr:hypothetical protein [Gossypium aridum]
ESKPGPRSKYWCGGQTPAEEKWTTKAKKILDPFIGEVIACLQAARFGMDLGFQSVTLGKDALRVINEEKCNKEDNLRIRAFISNIKAMLSNFRVVKLVHVSRTINKVVHLITKDGLIDNVNRFGSRKFRWWLSRRWRRNEI